jgi:hypothetical protein
VESTLEVSIPAELYDEMEKEMLLDAALGDNS